MKKIMLVAAVAALSLSSCKKEYTCECTVTTYMNGTATTSTASGTTEKMKKSEAEDKCNKSDSMTGDTTNGIKSECGIK